MSAKKKNTKRKPAAGSKPRGTAKAGSVNPALSRADGKTPPKKSANTKTSTQNASSRGTQNGRVSRKKKPAGLFIRVRRVFSTLKKELARSDVFPKAAFFSIVMLLVFGAIYLVTNKNAYGVMVGTEQVAVIKKDKKITADALLKAAVEKVETDLGTVIEVQEVIRFASVHAAKKDMQTPDAAILKIADNFTYTIEAVAINVGDTAANAVTMAILKNRREAEEVEAAIMEQYIPPELNIVEKGFVEYFSMDTVYVEMDEITTKDKALNILTVTTPSAEVYTVQPGDTLEGIAGKYGMSTLSMLEINPGHSINSVLQIGEQLTVRTAKPLLSVRTVEAYTLTEVEPKKDERRDNPNLARGQVRTVQYGSDGQAEVTYHVVRINGIETERSQVDRVITVAPVDEVIDVGTG